MIPNKEYKAKFDFLLDDCFGLMAAPLGISAMIAAYTHGEEWLDQVREYIDENIAYVHDFLQKNMPEVTMSDTQGTYLIWLDFRAYCNDEKRSLCTRVRRLPWMKVIFLEMRERALKELIWPVQEV